MLNQVQLIGHLGHPPSMRNTPSGEKVANFSIATSERWRDKLSGDVKEETEWHSVSVFGRLADIAEQHLNKGSQVWIQGKIKSRRYTDKNGQERTAHGIVAEQLRMLGGRESGASAKPANSPAQAFTSAYPKPSSSASASGFDDMDDDIPF
jgi:single-strand DNA-binding protein